MANIYDRFDVKPAAGALGPPRPDAPGNIYDQFDPEPETKGGSFGAVGRIGSAVAGGVEEGLGLDNPLGLGPETVQQLRDVGLFLNETGSPLLKPFQTFNEVLMRGSAEAADAALRGINALFKGGIEGIAQTVSEFGGQKNQARRETQGMLDTAGIMFPPMAIAGHAQRARSLSRFTPTRRASERMEDVRAFEDIGVQPLGPALTEVGTAGAAKQIEKAPLLGGPLRNARDTATEETAEAMHRIAGEFGARGGAEEAGQTLQRGITRFRETRTHELDRPTAEAAGVPFRHHMDDLTNDQVETLVRTPANMTSFGTRQEALYESAHRKLPPLMRSNNTRNPNLIPTVNAGRAVRGIVREEEAARIQGGAIHGRFGQLIQDLANRHSNFTIEDLRHSRTQIGRALGGFAREAASLDRTQLRQVYRGISQDLEAAYQTMAERALRNHRQYPASDPRYVSMDVVEAANRALFEFRRADRYTRLAHSRMDKLLSVTRAAHPEDAVRALTRAANKTTLKLGLIREARAALNRDEFGEVVGHMIRDMGVPGKQAKGLVADLQFNPSQWASNWRGMDPRARRLLFRGAGSRDLEQSLDSLARVTQRLSEYEALTNYSRTATQLIGASAVIGGPAYLASGAWGTALIAAGGTYAFAKFMSSPTYVRWLTRGYRLAVRNNSGKRPVSAIEWGGYLNSLRLLAGKDREIGPALEKVIHNLAGGDEDQAVAEEPDYEEIF